jgi:hypothetical protein
VNEQTKLIPPAEAIIDLPKAGDRINVGCKVGIVDRVETNQIDGKWPDDAWPQITIAGHFVEAPK